MNRYLLIATLLIGCKLSAQNVVFSFSVDNTDPIVSVVSVFAEGTENTNNEMTTFGVRLYYDISEATVTLPGDVSYQGAIDFGWTIGTNTTATNNTGMNGNIPITHTHFLEVAPFDEVLAGTQIPMGTPTLFFTVTFNKTPGNSTTGGEVYLGATDTDPSLGAADENLDPFDVVAVGVRQLILPLKLLDFSARTLDNKSSLLEWRTQDEINTSHFEIERSTDLNRWDIVGEVEASFITSQVKQYNFIDQDVFDGLRSSTSVHYRLRMVDLDDRYSYSPIKTVHFRGDGIAITEFLAYPNPAKEGVTIEWDSYAAGQPTLLEVFDAAGKQVYSRPVAHNSNQEYIDFAQAGVHTGHYLVRILSGDEVLDVKQIIVGQN